MKNIIIKYLIITCFISLTACIDSVLDKRPLDIISEDVVWNDPNLVDSYIAGLYAQMYIFRFDAVSPAQGSWEQRSEHLNITNVSDEVGRAVWFDYTGGFKTGSLTISGGLLEWWDNAYSIIRNLNKLLENLPNSVNEPDFIESRVAEARFLRAFNYFALVKRYGGVPLITKEIPIDAPDEELYPIRDSEQKIYDFIISEMDAIEESVKSFNTYGRVSQGAVLALKSRAALYAGSIAQFGTVQLNGLL
ncbi:MAG: RagB/SusD family nutrient uptake outer membrane protein [Tannerella sp.]|jgi:hypothetical protein|nr:RagB/SusD family nutrient uptake outer membrane protein [Tannerella sp.]